MSLQSEEFPCLQYWSSTQKSFVNYIKAKLKFFWKFAFISLDEIFCFILCSYFSHVIKNECHQLQHFDFSMIDFSHHYLFTTVSANVVRGPLQGLILGLDQINFASEDTQFSSSNIKNNESIWFLNLKFTLTFSVRVMTVSL